MINFPFGTNGKLIILGVPILKHITVVLLLNSLDKKKQQQENIIVNCALKTVQMRGYNIY